MHSYRSLCHFSPMPPARNGIADYAFQVIRKLSHRYPSTVVCDDAFAMVPNGVTLGDSVQAFRFVQPDTCCIYQIGNNWDHSFVIPAAHSFPGIVVLHDINLLYLHESLEFSDDQMLQQLTQSNPHLASVRAASIVKAGHKLRSDYALFHMSESVVRAARAVVVHSSFAKSIIQRHIGADVADRIHVIPHFAYTPPSETRAAARRRLGLEPGWHVIVTCGFATPVKRYDWLVAALDRVAASRRNLVWVQAGPVRPHEFDLEALVARYPRVRSIVRYAGYLSEADLEGYIASADIVINLRFPSVGESSGILARALSAGACCVVTDIASYREFPDDVLIKIPPTDAVGHLVSALSALIDSPDIVRGFGSNAKRYALGELSLEAYDKRFETVIEASKHAHHRSEVDAPTPETRTSPPMRLYAPDTVQAPGFPALEFGSEVHFAVGPLSDQLITFDTLGSLLPPTIRVDRAAFVAADEGYDADGDVAVSVEIRGAHR